MLKILTKLFCRHEYWKFVYVTYNVVGPGLQDALDSAYSERERHCKKCGKVEKLNK